MMNWADVIADPCLQDLPYKIELDEHGAIVMTPASNRHARLQSRIYSLLSRQAATGETIVECAVATRQGVRVPDVAWMSDEFVARYGDSTPYNQAPEVCVEVVSPSDSGPQMVEKIQLYFAQGALEVWLCGDDGSMELHHPAGQQQTSKLFPKFPQSITK